MGESKEQADTVKWFKSEWPEYQECILSIPNGQILGGRNKFAQLAKLKKEGFKNGASDLFIAVPAGGKHGLWLEMKDVGKTECSLSADQKKHLTLMSEMGYLALWAAGFEKSKEIISAYMNDPDNLEIDLIDGLFAYDTGCVSSGIYNAIEKERLIDMDVERLYLLLKKTLIMYMNKEEYTIEDAYAFTDWCRDQFEGVPGFRGIS